VRSSSLNTKDVGFQSRLDRTGDSKASGQGEGTFVYCTYAVRAVANRPVVLFFRLLSFRSSPLAPTYFYSLTADPRLAPRTQITASSTASLTQDPMARMHDIRGYGYACVEVGSQVHLFDCQVLI
jgi:hypothetical protein